MYVIVTVYIAAETRAFCFIGGHEKHYNNCLIKWKLETKQTRSEIIKLRTGKIEDGEGIGGFHAISGDKNNHGEMNKCWWTNKAS